ncbi:Uncharacterized protein dnl_20060 [Desulfonema limicola]|uniref:Uncharacterized protein n=1 Tax=Desulfonema limicola TaxID=45656 RepID=A0A975B6I4_9BACT|nr:Uncharacterized protein dnl_20060 [Desulfonema limicola]
MKKERKKQSQSKGTDDPFYNALRKNRTCQKYAGSGNRRSVRHMIKNSRKMSWKYLDCLF